MPDGFYPDLSKKNSYCVCKNSKDLGAKYIRCDNFPGVEDTSFRYDAFSTPNNGNSYLSGDINGIDAGCGGYHATRKRGVCVDPTTVSPKGLNRFPYTDSACCLRPFSSCPSNRRLNTQPQEQPLSSAVVVVSQNSASFATTIKLSTIVNKDSAAASTTVPYRRGTVFNATLTLLLALISHFFCL